MKRIDMNWDDPAARAELVERVGVQEYNRLFEKHKEASTVSVVNGFAIRPVVTRFGQLFLVDGAGQAFFTLKEAEACAWQTTKEYRGVAAFAPSASDVRDEVR